MNNYVVMLECFNVEYMFNIDDMTNTYTDLRHADSIIVDFYTEFELFKEMYHDTGDIPGGYELSFFRYIIEFIWLTLKTHDRVEIELVMYAIDFYISDVMSLDTDTIDSEIFLQYNMDNLNIIINSVFYNRDRVEKDNKNTMLKHWVINNNIIYLILTGG